MKVKFELEIVSWPLFFVVLGFMIFFWCLHYDSCLKSFSGKESRASSKWQAHL